MAKRWTAREDGLIRRAAEANREHGLSRDGHVNRLRRLAERLGRSYAAVLHRAQRIGARSYHPGPNHENGEAESAGGKVGDSPESSETSETGPDLAGEATA